MSLTVFLLFCFLFCNVKSAVYYLNQVEIPGHEGKCYDKTEKIFYSKGEIIENEGNECAQRKCLGFSTEMQKLRIEILTCPKVEAGPGCFVIQDPSKPYPGCCPQLVSSMPSVQPQFCETQKREQE